MKVSLSGNPIRTGILSDEDEIFMGFDRMTDDEIIFTMQNTPYPEFMGGKLKDWFKRRKTRAKALVQKVKTKFKKMPKWAKVATGVLAAPLALPAAAAVIPTAAAVTSATLPAVLPAATKILPVAASAALARNIARKAAAKKAAAARKENIAKVRVNRAALARQRMRRTQATNRRMMTGRPVPVVTAVKQPTVPAPVYEEQYTEQVTQQPTTQQPEQKKGGLGGLLALGALGALPFFL